MVSEVLPRVDWLQPPLKDATTQGAAPTSRKRAPAAQPVTQMEGESTTRPSDLPSGVSHWHAKIYEVDLSALVCALDLS